MRGIDAVERAAVVELRGEIAHRLHARLVGVEQRDDRARRGGTLRELAHVVGRHRVLLEQRIGEDLLQGVGEARVRVVRERLQIDVEDLRELHQQMRGQRPLVVLDEIEVARRDLQPLGELRLGELLLAAQRPNLGTEFDL